MSKVDKHSIMGNQQTTADRMIQFVKKVNPSFNPLIAQSFHQISPKYGVRGDLAFCQSIHETNWFRYGGDVQPAQHNFAGLGATGGVRGASFPTVDAGVTAQIQHLYAYATNQPLPPGEPLIDPRFHLVNRGSAPYWEDLSGKWAVPGYDRKKYSSLDQAQQAGATYGQQIIHLYEQMVEQTAPAPSPTQQDPSYPANTPLWKKEAVDWMYNMGLLSHPMWKQKIEEPLPLWAEAVVLKRLMERE